MALKLIPPQGAGLATRLAKQAFHKPLIEAVTKALDIENEGLNKTIASVDFWKAAPTSIFTDRRKLSESDSLN